MEMWGSRIKLPKLAENMFNNQQGLKATKKALGGWRGWGVMRINDNGRSERSSLNNIVRVHRGTVIIGGIGSPHIDAPAIPTIEVCGVLITERGDRRRQQRRRATTTTATIIGRGRGGRRLARRQLGWHDIEAVSKQGDVRNDITLLYCS